MSMVTMYGIRNCDTVKKARAWLDQETLLNRAGTTFRKLAPSEKESLDEKRAVALMLAQPAMIKRPVLELGGRLVVGFKPELYQSLQW